MKTESGAVRRFRRGSLRAAHLGDVGPGQRVEVRFFQWHAGHELIPEISVIARASSLTM